MLDLELTNCKVFGVDESINTIGMREGRIVSLGNSSKNGSKLSIDLEGRVVVPGYIDSHTHLLNLGLSMVRLDLSETETRAEAIDKVRSHAEISKSKVIVGYGWDETRWGEKDYLGRSELDFTAKPVILYRKDMHMAVLNSKALSIASIESSNGTVKEEAMRKIDALVEPDDGEIRVAIHAAAIRAASEGITTVRDIMGYKTKQQIELMRLPIRIFHTIYDREETIPELNHQNSWGIKTFLDGSIGAESAAHGGWSPDNLKFTDEHLSAHLQSFWKMGIPVAMHAIGERAVHQAISALKDQKGRLRNSIEHFELVNREELECISKSTVVSSQPNFLQWSLKGGLYENKLGSEWYGKDNPFREIVDAEVNLAFGSDCMPIGPSYGIGLAVNSPHTDQRITLEEAVRAYTSGGAFVLHEEYLSGRIKLGFRADLAVFNAEYLSDMSGIGNRKAKMTILEGKIAYSAE